MAIFEKFWLETLRNIGNADHNDFTYLVYGVSCAYLTFDTTEKIKKKTDQIHRSLAAPLGFLQTKGQQLSVLEKCRVQMSEVCKKYM